ncbi:uncharacterized protein LOC110446889 [Mizuhopecten yessoensis]|uniref:uncharacterized protein LOC110446889 n=1 Tax=Mizuhopecten yessoensis TaxID=6573 RepID=UPI000B45A839|nr:uncharacterized protein LOC110446889 [Mizuhopecten yessoensis]
MFIFLPRNISCLCTPIHKLSYFYIDLLRTVPSGVTASINNLDNLCSTTVTTSNQQTQSTWPSSTAYTPTSAVTGIGTLEPSSTDPTAVIETSSESTPPLSNVVTSVKLEITSLPTATEKTVTISATCSTCSCIKPTPVDQNKLEESLSKLKEQLLINPKKLSSYKRALTSAPDDRKSAANIGYIGILVLCLVPGIIILLDMGRLIREFKQFIIRLRNSQRTTAKITPIERT